MESCKTNKKVGLTLGGGGARGFAHIGAYEVLIKHGIPIHCITGCSIGAIVGAGIAQGKSPEELLEIVKEFADHKPIGIKDLGFGNGSIFSGNSILRSLKKLIPEDLEFKDLKIPLSVNAVDLESGEQIVFDSGNVLEAVMASSALPGLYPPVFYQDRLFVDGGVVNSIPVDICRGMGAEIIIAVDLKSYVSQQNMAGMIYHFYVQPKKEEKYHLSIKKGRIKETKLKLAFPVNVMMRALAITERRSAERIMEMINPEFVIHPEVSDFGMLDFEQYADIYDEGRRAAEDIAIEILESIDA
ncbi:MAG: patatin-like phospholipase family protein [Candidatus Peregrinibacteria bacterium]|nr:patatin-like phospholipase family protein [Candidatus Peregrinibacteria bacterium]MDZ4244680.1 patatin-like phospholipase family protein [Candidatus Gracilibacteria bacterium]